MRLPGRARPGRAARLPRGGGRWRLVILLYHRVAEPDVDPWAMSVTPRRFAEQLATIRRVAQPLRLAEAARALRDGTLPRRSVVITFDDGYADNLHHAAPALAAHDLPATIFLTSGAIGRARGFWWDELGEVLLRPGRLPARGGLPLDGQPVRWDLGSSARYTPEDARQHRAWRAWEPAPTARHALYRLLWERLQPLDDARQRDALAALRDWAGTGRGAAPAHRTLSDAEATALAGMGRVEIGAHTVSHPALAALPVERQREEIHRSKTRLEGLAGGPVTGFSYPYGRRCDYTAETVAAVREAAFTCACANFPGVVTPAAPVDPFQLPRVNVGDWGGREFGARLRRWFDGAVP